MTTGTRFAFNGRAVFGRDIPPGLPHARRAGRHPDSPGERHNPTEDVDGLFKGCHVGFVYHDRDSNPNTNVNQGDDAITFVDTIAERLRSAREAAGLSQPQLAERAGVSQGTIGNIESGLRKSPRELLAIAAAVNVNPGWLKTGKGPRDWAGGTNPDQAVSHTLRKIVTKRFTWEQILAGEELGDLFVSTMPDDSAAPEFPRGLDVMWSTTKPAQYGSLVLVRDRHSQLHARQYRQGREPGHWLATPLNGAFASFDSATDGLQIVAVAAFKALP